MTCTTMIYWRSGNKQPLYYDALLSASGPIKIQDNFMEDTWYFMNQTRVRGYIYISPLNAANECDNRRRSRQFPRVKRLRLTAATGSKNYGRYYNGASKRCIPSYEGDSAFTGNYNASLPTSIPGSGNQRIDGTTAQMYM